MEKILILGTGNAQKDLINYCIKEGLEVFACSNISSNYSKALGKNFAQIDIRDEKRITNFVTENKINYIYSIGSDIAMPSIANVSKNLNLHTFIEHREAETCHDKSLARNIIPNEFNVKHMEISNILDLDKWRDFPCIIKPVDSQGQRGVFIAQDGKELESYFDDSLKYSFSKRVIVEQLILGDEISVNAYVVDGDVIFSIISDRISFKQYPGGIIKEHILPSKYEKDAIVKRRVVSLVEECVNEIGIKNGPVYFQIKIGEEKKPKLIEMTPRLDGCHLWRLIKLYYGIDLIDITIKHLVKKEVDFSKLESMNEKEIKAEKYNLIFLTQKPKTLMKDYNLKIDDKVKYFEYYYEIGDIIQPINSFAEKVGYYISI